MWLLRVFRSTHSLDWVFGYPIGVRLYALRVLQNSYVSFSITILSDFLNIAINSWYEKLGDGTLAEAILDRIIHNSYDIFIDGKISMREKLDLNQE